jgi:NADH-quinone oxidoreductase subunit M
VFHGPRQEQQKFADLSAREMAVFSVLIAAIVWMGLYPQPLLKTAKPALEALERPAVAQQARAQK